MRGPSMVGSSSVGVRDTETSAKVVAMSERIGFWGRKVGIEHRGQSRRGNGGRCDLRCWTELEQRDWPGGVDVWGIADRKAFKADDGTIEIVELGSDTAAEGGFGSWTNGLARKQRHDHAGRDTQTENEDTSPTGSSDGITKRRTQRDLGGLDPKVGGKGFSNRTHETGMVLAGSNEDSATEAVMGCELEEYG